MKLNRAKIHSTLEMLRHPNFRAAGHCIAGLVTEGWYVKGDEMSRDRVRLLMYNYEANIVANLIGGTFYTGLLLLMNASDSFIGSMSMIATAANLLQLFAPLLLERFAKRKKLLLTMRAMLMFFNVLFLGLIPIFPLAQQTKLLLVSGTVLIVNVLNAFFNPGMSVWTIQSVPQNVRGSFFTIITMTVGAVVALFNLGGSAVVDFFTARGNQYLGLMLLRVFCLVLLTVDMISLSKMKEYPYPGNGNSYTVRDLLITPFKEKKYLRTVAVTFLWNIAANIPGSYYTVYLLKEIQVSYSFIMLFSMLNVPIVLLLTPVWSRLGRKLNMSWFKMLYCAMGLYMLHYVLLGFVTANALWVYPVALILAYTMGIGINLSFTCIPYVNIPEKNQTAYIGFYAAAANFAAFLGVYIGKLFVTGTEGFNMTLLGMQWGGKQLLMLLTAALMFVSVCLICRLDRANLKDELMEKGGKNIV